MIESLSFNLETQKSIKKKEKYTFFLASEILFNDSTIKNFRQFFRKLKIQHKDEYYKSISNKIFLPGSDQFYPILFNEFDSIINYFQNSLIFIQNDFFDYYKKEYKKVSEEFYSVNKAISKEINFISSKSEVESLLRKKEVFTLFNYTIKDSEYFNFSEDEFFSKNKKKNLEIIPKKIVKDTKIIFCTQSKTNNKKIVNYLENNSINFSIIQGLKFELIQKKSINFFVVDLSILSSFSIKYENLDILVLSDFDFFEKITKRLTKPKSDVNIINEFSQLSCGDLVCIDHGIGKFNGLRNKDVNGFSQDFIEILYHNNDSFLFLLKI